MIYYKINPLSLPKIKFAHYFAKNNYKQQFPYKDEEIEICYIKNGYFDIEVLGQKIRIPQGSMLIFCRKITPVIITAEKNTVHMHYTCSVKLDYELETTDNLSNILNCSDNVLLLPIFLPPSDEIKALSKKLNQIIIDYNASENNSTTCAISVLGLLGELAQIYKRNLFEKSDISSSILCYKIKKYISSNITKNISLTDISKEIEKTPNYLNSVFRKVEGISIGQYITREKIHTLIEIKKTRDISFDDACICIGITDISYGYRLFKKHIGTTPKIYFENLL